MRLVPMFERDAQKGSKTAFVLYVIGALTGLAVFAVCYQNSVKYLAKSELEGILIGLAAGLVPTAFIIALANIVEDIKMIRINTSGYYIEYDESDFPPEEYEEQQ